MCFMPKARTVRRCCPSGCTAASAGGRHAPPPLHASWITSNSMTMSGSAGAPTSPATGVKSILTGPEHMTKALQLKAAPLTAEAFAPYGQVIASVGEAEPMTQGMGQRFRDLAIVDVLAESGRPAISRVRCLPEPLPIRLRLMERHPLSTQAFIPADGQRYVVVVAPAGEPPQLDALRAFVCSGGQGISYGRGIWHHPM